MTSLVFPSAERASYPRFENGEVHDWYRLVHGYTDELVTDILDELRLGESATVLDPFCGAGTTLVECKKRGIPAVGIEANPSSYFAAKAKTNWDVQPNFLIDLLSLVAVRYDEFFARKRLLNWDKSYKYIYSSGMLERGWISHRPLEKVIALKLAIRSLFLPPSYHRLLMLALIAELVKNASNVKFGPELYCGKRKRDVSVLRGFCDRVARIADDLVIARAGVGATTTVIQGDARRCSELMQRFDQGPFDAVITSPPYPTEHDYTRNSRLELALLEAVDGNDKVRKIKEAMIRSHTKGIYIGDDDAKLVANNTEIEELAQRIDTRAKNKTDGFARLYSRVLREYFGGMKRHLKDIRNVLKPNAILAYVIGDQASYFRIHVPTAQILGKIAESVGFERVAIRRWRSRVATATQRTINENIIYLQR